MQNIRLTGIGVGFISMVYTYPELNKYSDTHSLQGECWRGIGTHKGVYEVSNYGRVRSLPWSRVNSNQTTSWVQQYEGKLMKVHPDSRGYPQVRLVRESIRVARVHRLVAEAFLLPPTQALISECLKGGVSYVLINHKDNNPSNPFVENLEWCTPSYNNTYTSEKRGINRPRGVKSANSKLTEKEVLEICGLLDSKEYSQQKIADMFSINQITVSNIKCGRSWVHITGYEECKIPVKRNKITSRRLSESETH